MLKGRLVVGPCAITTFQGPKGNAAKEPLVGYEGVDSDVGGMEDELFYPSGGI